MHQARMNFSLLSLVEQTAISHYTTTAVMLAGLFTIAQQKIFKNA